MGVSSLKDEIDIDTVENAMQCIERIMTFIDVLVVMEVITESAGEKFGFMAYEVKEVISAIDCIMKWDDCITS